MLQFQQDSHVLVTLPAHCHVYSTEKWPTFPLPGALFSRAGDVASGFSSCLATTLHG